MPLTDPEARSTRELRKYGLVMASALAVLSAISLLRGSGVWKYTGSGGLLFIVTALLVPGILAPVEKVWMKFAEMLGFVMTRLLLTLVFILAVIPTGLIMRLLGKDPLRRKFEPGSSSYWITVDENGPGTRHTKPY